MNENESKKILIFGDGGLSTGFINNFSNDPTVSEIYYTSRKRGFNEKRSGIKPLYFNFDDFVKNQSIGSIESILNKKPNVIIFATGILHSEKFMPEKKIDEVELANLYTLFNINAFVPFLILKKLIHFYERNDQVFFGFISARVGSIEDNRLGGWYSYRASKASLNMLIKTASIELKRTHPKFNIKILHPGTVDTNLSKPFAKNSNYKIMSPNESTEKMIKVLFSDSEGLFFDFNGKEIKY